MNTDLHKMEKVFSELGIDYDEKKLNDFELSSCQKYYGFNDVALYKITSFDNEYFFDGNEKFIGTGHHIQDIPFFQKG